MNDLIESLQVGDYVWRDPTWACRRFRIVEVGTKPRFGRETRYVIGQWDPDPTSGIERCVLAEGAEGDRRLWWADDPRCLYPSA